MTWLKVDISFRDCEGEHHFRAHHTIKASDFCMLFPRRKAEALLEVLEAGAMVRLRKVEKK